MILKATINSIFIIALLTLAGCGPNKKLDTNPPPTADRLIDLSIKWVVAETISANHDPGNYAAKIKNISDTLKENIETDRLVELDYLRKEINSLVNWYTLDPEETFLTMTLIEVVSNELERRISQRSLPEEQLVMVHSIFEVINQATDPWILD